MVENHGNKNLKYMHTKKKSGGNTEATVIPLLPDTSTANSAAKELLKWMGGEQHIELMKKRSTSLCGTAMEEGNLEMIKTELIKKYGDVILIQ